MRYENRLRSHEYTSAQSQSWMSSWILKVRPKLYHHMYRKADSSDTFCPKTIFPWVVCPSTTGVFYYLVNKRWEDGEIRPWFGDFIWKQIITIWTESISSSWNVLSCHIKSVWQFKYFCACKWYILNVHIMTWTI